MEFIQDDSYEGQNLRFSYDSFLSLWQAFNYEYLILVSPDKKNVVEQILQDQKNPSVAWKLAYTRALQESEDQPENIYPLFNQSVALYHLGEYQKSIETYELVAGRLPRRMLWYQLQPIQSYLEIGSYDKVYTLTGQILNNENRGYSELYLIRGDAYLRQGDRERAREEYERAVFYNQNLSEAQQALESLVNTIE
jgi:tetratricopeptide (TPR) repeat protein